MGRFGLRQILVGAALVASSLADDAPPPLAERVRRYVEQPAFVHATWGIAVAARDSGASRFELGAEKLLKPASNAKLFTLALALDRLGPAFRIRTDLIPTGPVTRDGTLQGDLVVYGRGDFSWAARFHRDHPDQVLDSVTSALAQAGLRRIRGQILADDSFFVGPPLGHGWAWEDLQYYYGAEVCALTVDDNVVDLVVRPGLQVGDPLVVEPLQPAAYLHFVTAASRTGAANEPRKVRVARAPSSPLVVITGSLPVGGESWTDAVSVPEPARYLAARLAGRLAETGIPVDQGSRRAPGAAASAARHGQSPPPITVASPPLEELANQMMKPSQNLYAQLLLLQVGATLPPGEPGESTESRGLRALRLFLEEAGVPAEEARLDDGSGLSRSSLVTANAITRLLVFMARHRHARAFLDALPTAGVDGTLRRRLTDASLPGNVRAKTGTLRYVDTLSGYVTNRSGEPLVFSVLLNAYDPPPGGPSGREAVDEIARLVATSVR